MVEGSGPEPRREPESVDPADPELVGISGRAVVIALLAVAMIVAVGVYLLAGWISSGNVGVTVRPQ